MSRLRLLQLFAAVMLGVLAPRPLCAQASLPPFDLALTLNDGVSRAMFRGWPLLLRGDAVLMRDVAVPFALELPSLTLAIAPAQGPAASWPLRRVTEFSATPTLGPANESVRVVWILSAEQTAALAPGDYTARLSWAGRTSPPIKFSVSDAPSPLPANDEIRRALLQSQASLYLGDAAGAIAALVPAEARHPESIDLLVQRGRAHLQRREHREALEAAQRARAIFDRDYPEPGHPPASINQVEARARAELFKEIAPGPPLPGLPGREPRTVSSTPNPVPAVLRPTPATPPVEGTPSVAVPTSPAPTVTPSTAIVAALGTVVPAAELVDAKIRADAAGQWAASARAGTEYGRTQYSAARATGAPNVPIVGNSPDAWCPAVRNVGMDWLEVAYANPTRATEVRARQSDASGAIVKVEAFEPDGTAHTWWEGKDPYVAPAIREIVWFAVRVPPTSYRVARVKLTLNLASGPGYKQIDAVQLVAAP